MGDADSGIIGTLKTVSGITDVGAVAGALKSVSDLANGVLSREDRDALNNDLHEDTTKVQNSFANNNSDDQWTMAYRLFNDIGRPLTPGLVGKSGEREFRHHALISLAELKYTKAVLARLIAQRTS